MRFVATKKQRIPLAVGGIALFFLIAFPVLAFLRFGGTMPPKVVWAFVYTNPMFWVLLFALGACILLAAKGGGYRFARPSAAFALLGTKEIFWRITPRGLAGYTNGVRTHTYSPAAFTTLYQNQQFVVVLHKSLILAAFPLRCFLSRQQAYTAYSYLKKTPQTPLAFQYTPGLWRAFYMLTPQNTAFVRHPAWQQNNGKRLLGSTFILLLCSTALAVALLLRAPLAYTWVLALAAAAGGGGALFLLLFSRPPKLVLPPGLHGLCTLTLGKQGVRLQTEIAELYTEWRHITATYHHGHLLLLHSGVAVALIPAGTLPPAEVQQAFLVSQTMCNTAGI